MELMEREGNRISKSCFLLLTLVPRSNVLYDRCKRLHRQPSDLDGDIRISLDAQSTQQLQLSNLKTTNSIMKYVLLTIQQFRGFSDRTQALRGEKRVRYQLTVQALDFSQIYGICFLLYKSVN